MSREAVDLWVESSNMVAALRSIGAGGKLELSGSDGTRAVELHVTEE